MAAALSSTVDYTNRTAVNSSWGETATPQSPLELGFLWLPYIVFTVVLLSLIAMSFLRFHCERGQQYRRRQEEFGDKQQHLDNMRLLATSDGPQPNGGPSHCVPEQYNLFMQYSQILPDDDDDDMTSTRSRGAANGRKGGSGGGQARRPIVFTFNSNGSMVDVRCDEEERTNTFRLIPNADSAGGDDVSVVEIDLGNGELDDLEPRSPPSSSTRHRDRRRLDDRLSPNSAVSLSAAGRTPALGGTCRRPASSDYSGQNHLDALLPASLNRHQQRQVAPSTISAAVTAHQQRARASGSTRQQAAPPPPSTQPPPAQIHHAHAQRHHRHRHPSASTSPRSTLFAPRDSSQRNHRDHSSDEEITCAAEALLLWQKRV